ncbi:hypothetical protein SY86_23075 [Erwinia tracheiphila]|uniref:Uncharacterized protein n=1 Tax=Erwinia tracheiphila TaxID=65700 RepID=A0A0M2KE06_9GAMM|nr:hypothetical protein ETR_20752 [Erwinia tracheiphila PSU-1]KKF37620.1 hypothetical protein SY86_23075 [Erwinia tracheiphila]
MRRWLNLPFHLSGIAQHSVKNFRHLVNLILKEISPTDLIFIKKIEMNGFHSIFRIAYLHLSWLSLKY